MLRNIVAACVVSASLTGTCAAEIVAYPEYGLSVEVPEGFKATRINIAGYVLTIAIDPVSGVPRLATDSEHVCEVNFQEVLGHATHDQDWFNARALDPAILAQARASMEGAVEITSDLAFKLGAVEGHEYVGAVRQYPGSVATFSFVNTPRGLVLFNCTTIEDDLESALPVLRAIRDSIVPPQ